MSHKLFIVDISKPKLENRLKLAELYEVDLMDEKHKITIIQNQKNKDSQVANGYKVSLNSTKAILKISENIENLASLMITHNELIAEIITGKRNLKM